MIALRENRERHDIGRVRAQSIRDVVFLFPGALGDLLLALPTLRALRVRHRTAHVTAVVSEPLRALIAPTGVADVTASLDGADTAWLFGGARCPAWLAGRPLVYSWLGARDDTLRARLESVAAGVHCFAVERGGGRPHAAIAYARAVGVTDRVSTLVARARIVAPASPRAEALWRTLAGPTLAIHPGAGAPAKRWAAAGFVRVAEWWRRDGGCVVTVSGPAEDDVTIAGSAPVRGWALPDVAAVLARAALYLGNDSGVSHLAAAVGARGVVLFGTTDPRRWRPLGDGVVSLHAPMAAPAGMSLAVLPAARVVAACQRQIALTRENLETSVRPAAPRIRGCT